MSIGGSILDIETRSANQQYKDSGSSLSFKDWIEREKAKGIVIPQFGVTDLFNKAESEIELEKDKSSKKIFGLDKRVLIFSALMIIGAISYKKLYKK